MMTSPSRLAPSHRSTITPGRDTPPDPSAVVPPSARPRGASARWTRLAVFAAVAGLALFVRIPVATATAEPPGVEVENPDWDGLTRWYGAARSARIDVRPGPLALDTLPPKAAVALIAPEVPPPADALLRFVREGGRLLVADEGDGAATLYGALGLRLVPAPAGGVLPLPGVPGVGVLTPRATGVFDGVGRLFVNHPAAFAPVEYDAAVRFSDGTPFAFHVAVGQGAVLAVADSSVFINLMQTVPDNARFAANVMGWLSEDGARPVMLLAGHDAVTGEYAGVAPPDEALSGPAAVNRLVEKLSSARPDDPLIRIFVALLLAAACIYALAVFPGPAAPDRRPGPRLPPPPPTAPRRRPR
ncbi:DUF4350 domain-containing protein [Myxococcota bacterium]|nr:DUF4350 domain-containing protein [Myxococcota bacterium]